MSSSRADLHAFFHPESVALVGSTAGMSGPALHDRWGPTVHLVNPRGGQVDDLVVHRTIGEIETPVDLVVINVAPQRVNAVLVEAADHGVPFAVVFASGFSEVGPDGAALEAELAATIARTGIRVFGPNTNTNAFEVMPEVKGMPAGKIALVTQSGHQGRPLVQGSLFNIGFTRWVPTGNEVDLEVSDFIEYFAADEESAVIAGYIEGFRSGPKLRRALAAANAADKPVVLIKIGRTEEGSRMASSHTGHLTGADADVDGLFAQHGVTRVDDLDELLETAALFAKLPPSTGSGVALYSVSGGSGTLMAELAASHGVPVPTLAAETQAALHELLPSYLTVANPVDNGMTFLGTASADERRRVLQLMADDPAVDLIVVGITGAMGPTTDTFVADIVSFEAESPVPIVCTWNSLKTDEAGFDALVESGLPLFRTFRNCFSAIAAHSAYRTRELRTRPSLAEPFEVPAGALGALGADTAGALLGQVGVAMVGEELVGGPEDAGAAFDRLGGPVVAKIASADIAHKTDLGLVRLGISSAQEAVAACRDLLDRAAESAPRARLDGVVLQRQIPDGVELILGVTVDPVMGSAVMVGAGGVHTEVFADVSVRPVPIDRADVHEMLDALRIRPLLDGVRGAEAADIESVVDAVMGVARLAESLGDRLVELDVNPLIAGPHGAVAVDALVVLAD